MQEKHSEERCVASLLKNGYPVNVSKKTITVSVITYTFDKLKILKRPIGNTLWGKIDFLTHYKGYKTIFSE